MACSQFKIILHNDGSYELEGISEEKFRLYYPAFATKLEDGKLEIDNFYPIRHGKVRECNRELLEIEARIAGDNIISSIPAESRQMKSWEYNGWEELRCYCPVIDDELTLDEFLSALGLSDDELNRRITNIRVLPNQNRIDEIVSVLEAGRLTKLSKIDIVGSIEEFNSLNIDALIDIMQTPQGRSSFSIEVGLSGTLNGSITISASEISFNIDLMAGYDIAQWDKIGDNLNAVINSIPMRSEWSNRVVHISNTVSPTEYGKYVDFSILEFLDAAYNQGFRVTNKVLQIDYGIFNPEDKSYTPSTVFHHYNEDIEATVALQDTYYPDYEAGCIAVASKIIGGIEWDGADVQDEITHEVMAIAHILAPEYIAIANIKYGAGFEANNDLTEIALNRFNRTQPPEGAVELRYPHEYMMPYITGKKYMDIEVLDADNNLVSSAIYATIPTIADIDIPYLLKVDSKPPILNKITVYPGYLDLEEAQGLRLNGVAVIKQPDNILNIPVPLDEISRWEAIGATSVRLESNPGYLQKDSDGNISTDIEEYEESAPFSATNFSGRTISTSGSSITIHSVEYNADAVAYKQSIMSSPLIDISALDTEEALDTIEDIADENTEFVADKSKLLANPVRTYLVLSAHRANIRDVGGQIVTEDEVFATMEHNPAEYYGYVCHNGNITLTPKLLPPPHEDSLLHKLGQDFIAVLNIVKSSLFNGYYSQGFKDFMDNGVELAEATILGIRYVLGDIEETTDNDGNKSQRATYRAAAITVNQDATGTYGDSVLVRDAVEIDELGESVSVLSDYHSMYRYISILRSKGADDSEWSNWESSGDGLDEPTDILDCGDVPMIEYTFTQGQDGEVIIDYVVTDSAGNDITDEFMTLTVGDKFMYRGGL